MVQENGGKGTRDPKAATGFHARDRAYNLPDSEAHRKFYDEWSETYDREFAESVGYLYPRNIAKRFLELARAEDGPVADIGCGTGLVGLALSGSGTLVDGFDISEGMLREARSKGVYRDLRIADLTSPDDLPRQRYGGLISSGTFTLGHLGPDALANALLMAREGALCLIGINARHFTEAGFENLLDDRVSRGALTELRYEEAAIYRDADASKSVNVAKLAVFRVSDQETCVR